MSEFLVVLLFALFLVAVGYILVLRGKLKRTVKTSSRLIAGLHKQLDIVVNEKIRADDAWQQGMDELEESYQQQLLEQYDPMAEEIERLNGTVSMKNDIIDLQEEELEYHRMSCLPHLSDIRLERIIREELEKAIP